MRGVDVSAFIRPRTYTPRDATIYQQRPAAIIEAAEETEAPAYPCAHPLLEPSTPLLIKASGSVVFVKHCLTAATPYALRDKSWPTTATAVIEPARADARSVFW